MANGENFDTAGMDVDDICDLALEACDEAVARLFRESNNIGAVITRYCDEITGLDRQIRLPYYAILAHRLLHYLLDEEQDLPAVGYILTNLFLFIGNQVRERGLYVDHLWCDEMELFWQNASNAGGKVCECYPDEEASAVVEKWKELGGTVAMLRHYGNVLANEVDASYGLYYGIIATLVTDITTEPTYLAGYAAQFLAGAIVLMIDRRKVPIHPEIVEMASRCIREDMMPRIVRAVRKLTDAELDNLLNNEASCAMQEYMLNQCKQEKERRLEEAGKGDKDDKPNHS